jgi:methionyl-tRNA formyltransferase
MGSPEFAVPALRALDRAFSVVGVMSRPDKPRGRGRKSLPTAVKAQALELGLPVSAPVDATSKESVGLLEEWAPDVIVVVAYGKILPTRILDLPQMGCVNLHASLLPRHRGASPISAAVLAGDARTGVSTILMDEGMDTGDILLSKEIPIDRENAGELHDKLMELGAGLIVETLEGMVDRGIEPRPQDHSAATYCRPLSKEDGVIDWSLDADYLGRLVRAMNPWPVAHCRLGDDVIKVRRADPREGSGGEGVIETIGPEGIAVGTGKGLLLLEEVQAPGRKRISGAEFARGRRLQEGDRFGDAC